jgi:two-component system C4-dicarboxylate transport response regulator DctD
MVDTPHSIDSDAFYNQLEIVIIDDDEDIRVNTTDLLSTQYPRISHYASARTWLKQFRKGLDAILLIDLRMPDADGFEVARQVLDIDSDMPVILMTGYGEVSIAVDAMKSGVFDFVEKPFDTDYLLAAVKRAYEQRQLVLTMRQSTQETVSGSDAIDRQIVGESSAIRRLRDSVRELAPMDIPVMIYGETGVGKELVARSLHEGSRRASGRFVALNCAAIPEQLAEAELFGYEKGAFTDASSAREGKLKHASGGTLFLDEVESLPLTTQAKLLRALSDQLVSPLGSNKEIPIDCRVVSATKDELRNNPDFRQDLFFRLQVSEIKITAVSNARTLAPVISQWTMQRVRCCFSISGRAMSGN